MQTKAGGFGCGALNRQPTVGTIRLQAVIVRMQLPQRTQLKVLSKQAVLKSIFRRLACFMRTITPLPAANRTYAGFEL